MIITRKQLTELEDFIGHSCEVGVLAVGSQGSIAVRVWAELPNGQTYNCQRDFTRQEYLNNSWKSEFERFKHWAKRELDKAFTE